MMTFCQTSPFIYLVTDQTYLKNSISLTKAVEQAILGGIKMVQLREKK